MSAQQKLREGLDKAALVLLEKYFVSPGLGEGQPDATDQIKAFDAVVKYYGPRTKLGGGEEKKESEIERLRGKLHGRRAPRRDSGGAAPNGNGGADGGPDAADDPAGTA